MEIVQENPFLIVWHKSMMVAAIVMVLSSIVVYLLYRIKVSSIKDLKDRYDYVTQNEIKRLKVVFALLALAVACVINMYGMGEIMEIGIWFFVRLFMSVAGATTVVYVSFLILEYYYPKIMNKKLMAWRYEPRINAKTGNRMRLLSEDEEDVHLDEGMLAEESVFSIDYDVWIDDKSGDIKIEKYPGHLQVLQCNSCGLYTMRVVKEEVVQPPSNDAPGELIKHYQCSYCKSIRATAFKISTKEGDDYRKVPEGFKIRNVDFIRLEIHSSESDKKFFEFQSIDQAQKFLKEYEYKKE